MSNGPMPDIKARVTSWEFILNCGVSCLPVDPYQLLLNYHVHVATLQKYASTIHKSASYIKAKYSDEAFCLFDGNQYFIFYDELLDELRRRFVLAHELGHAFLHQGNHRIKKGRLILVSTDKTESEANKFALRLLCPSVVLHLCGVRSADEIRQICGVDNEIAMLRWNHLQELRMKKRFLVKDEERMVMVQFAGFICDYVADKLK